ncbi:aminotransferase class III-fold pyridoxal phosphate-dependent enzyme [Pseudoalteromonas distincta]|uniref:aminotransferase class III-fold pyridoxal phosphate-dependent enzyme n=1 Tax=Pseudoalteromonas distincta TaxID=77608 RepID=UPI0011963DBE|nr:aminotransferase class III-fold pyridoxal phosphate-dependent enzyme [Pseudoalteromonas elyakovii]TVU76180.1 aminotransferase class III-fold pyridoxal phosphate-dependent enzyme [Pseudoalteromonas elyakovii]|tara:strand:+ start:4011 stop:5288 length:1278 start_codon:yes stop_codon:yes gene_type:complete
MNNYTNSREWLQRAEKTIPLGSQTFSKSKMSLPLGAAPMFLDKGIGSQIWDIDGNQYTDFINGLLCISLGYQDTDVDDAIRTQLCKGISFSLPHKLEAEVAELLVKLIPCAEMVRFAKNGSDVTSAAIRLARAYTNKEHIAVCGYHGWQDWYIGSTTRDLGVPQATKKLTHGFTYNDISSLEALIENHSDELAAVIMEPLNITPPEDGFLEKVRELCSRNGIVLIFDEIITGFRYHLGGAQSYFGVTPDLATFGKGMANGMPLSAIVGKREIMMLMNDIFFSGTFGGETLSLAAAKATIGKMQQVKFDQYIWSLGEYLIEQYQEHCSEFSMFELKGLAPWTFLLINEGHDTPANTIKSWLIQELCKRGILFIGSHNLSLSHTKKDIDKLINAYRELFRQAEILNEQHSFAAHLDGLEIESIFKVR